MTTGWIMAALLMLAGPALAQPTADPRNATTEIDRLEQHRQAIRTDRLSAMRNEPHRVGALFEAEAHAATQQLMAEQRRFSLGASDDLAIAARRRDLLAVRRAWAEWKQAAAAREAQQLLREEIAVAEMQVATEQLRVARGLSTAGAVAQRQADVAALREQLPRF